MKEFTLKEKNDVIDKIINYDSRYKLFFICNRYKFIFDVTKDTETKNHMLLHFPELYKMLMTIGKGLYLKYNFEEPYLFDNAWEFSTQSLNKLKSRFKIWKLQELKRQINNT